MPIDMRDLEKLMAARVYFEKCKSAIHTTGGSYFSIMEAARLAEIKYEEELKAFSEKYPVATSPVDPKCGSW